MANNLVLMDPNNVPAHLQDWEESNIVERETVPSLSYEGKAWTVVIKGEKRRLERKDADGDMVPVSVMRVVLLDFNVNRGRIYYEAGYDANKPGKPVCWSDDAKSADPSVSNPFEGWTGKCDTCPKSVKGSKVTDAGKGITACSLHRMVAVLPISKGGLFHTPLRMKLAITSLYDKDNPMEAEGWYAFDNYTKHLAQAMPGQHTAKLVTKMKFDPAVTYPKVMFMEERWVTDEEKATLRPLVKSEEVKDLVSGKWSPDGIGGTRRSEVNPEVVAQAHAVREAEEKVAAKPAPADDEDGEIEGEVLAPAKPAPAAKITAAQVVKGNGAATIVKAAAQAPKPAAQPAKAAAAPAKTAAASPELGALLSDWDA